MNYNIKTFSDYGNVNLNDNTIRFTADNDYNEAFFSLKLEFSDWEDDAHIMMPACTYNGNRYRRTGRYGYPMVYTKDEVESGEIIIPEVPALNPDGSGVIEVTSGDMSVPCVGIFYKKAKKGFFLYTEQAVKNKNIGFSVTNGSIELSFPANRKKAYRWSYEFAENVDSGIKVSTGEEIISKFRIFEFDSESIDAFYEKFFDTRKSLLSDERCPNLYTDKMWNIMEKHCNENLWNGNYYGSVFGVWAPGWCGGGMNTHTLFLCGNELSRERAEKTVDFMTSNQSEAGYYYGYNSKGERMSDRRAVEDGENLHLIRRSGDGLGYLIKQLEIINKPQWIESARKCADGLVNTFEKAGTFGHYVDMITGDVKVYPGCAGASAVGSLVRAYTYFENEKYIETAKKAGDMYYEKYLSKGISNGAISDAIGSIDSESIAAFVESYVLLYEATKDEKWLSYAKASAHILSTWVVTYSYKFPEGSEFNRLGINTVGSVFANIQNKHSAPGLCTSSGEYIYKLWQYTKDERYLELILDIVSFIPQCISTEDRPIYARILPEGGVQLDNPEKLKEGYVSERVNMSDWEGFGAVGNVFNASCWCESSLILTFGDLIYKYGLDW